MEPNNEEIEIDLKEIYYVLRAKLLIIILITILFALGAAVVSKFMIKPTYSSTSKLFVLGKSTYITSLADIQIGNSLTQDYMEMIQSRPVVDTVIDNLNLDATYETMVSKVDISNPQDTRMLYITVKDQDPKLAKELADEFAEVSRNRISEIMATTPPNIVEDGHLSKNPINSSVKKNVVIAALIGMLLSMGVIVVLHIIDDTIRTEADVEKYLGLNTLAMIPLATINLDDNKKSKRKGKQREDE